MRPLLILFFVAAGLPSLGAEELLLDQAIQLALAHNRGVANAGLDAAKAGDRMAAARTQQFPTFNFYALGAQQLNTFSFTFERGLLGTFPGTGPVPAEDTRVSTPLRPVPGSSQRATAGSGTSSISRRSERSAMNAR